MSNIAALTKLPAPSLPPPTLASGTVSLFPDDNWNNGFVMSTNDFRDSVRHAFDGTPIQDAATYAAFNLPVGTVLTLLENVAPTSNGQVWNLRDCGRCVDLVGTGTTEAVDLSAVNMNDCVSAFFWRQVDFDLGAIELFDDANFGGNRSTIFLGEWPAATAQSIDGWWLHDAVSSVRWWMMNDRQQASLFDNSDGTGRSYDNIQGWGTTKEIASLGDVGLNDCVSSFRWDHLVPKKEIIAPFTLDVEISASNSTTLQSQVDGVNDSTLPQPVTVTLNDASSQTLTVTTTETHVAGVKITAKTNWSVGIDATGKSGGELSVELSYSYTESATTTSSTTNTVALAISQVVNAPPKTHYVATLFAQIGKLPPTPFKTTAQRWYDQQVSGSERDLDPENKGWFKRVEPVTGTVEGGLACRVSPSIHATPLL
ncbi:MAG TPA: ETX/MTX2 family pore-forming toxin [Thermoanaerobaculia bacterium]